MVKFENNRGRHKDLRIGIKKVTDFPFEKQMEVLKWRNSKEISKNFLIQSEIDEETHKNWLESQKGDKPKSLAFFICDEEDERYGVIYLQGIDYSDMSAEVGKFLNPETFLEGVGIMAGFLLEKYAFDTLKLKYTKIRILDINKRILKTNLKNGYEYKGVIQKIKSADGVYHDVFYATLQAEVWRQRAPKSYEFLKPYLLE